MGERLLHQTVFLFATHDPVRLGIIHAYNCVTSSWNRAACRILISYHVVGLKFLQSSRVCSDLLSISLEKADDSSFLRISAPQVLDPQKHRIITY